MVRFLGNGLQGDIRSEGGLWSAGVMARRLNAVAGILGSSGNGVDLGFSYLFVAEFGVLGVFAGRRRAAEVGRSS